MRNIALMVQALSASTDAQRTTTQPAQAAVLPPDGAMLPMQHRAASLQPASFDPARNTVRVSWTNGARVRRFDWWTNRQYEEELVVTPDAVDMTRFEAGAVQVLDGHRAWDGVSAILGIAERGWIEGGEGLADIRLSQRQELAGIVADIGAGIIRDISVGYSVDHYQVIRAQDRKDGGTVDLWRATRWTPHEISFVGVPADASAGTRALGQSGNASQHAPQAGQAAPHAQQGPQFACRFTAEQATTTRAQPAAQPHQEHRMPQDATVADATATQSAASHPAQATAPSADAAARAAADDAMQRSADITELCARHGVPHLAAGIIRSGGSVDTARVAVLEEIARRDAAAGGHTNVRGIHTVQDEQDTRMRGIEGALMSRVDSRHKLDDNARQYRGMTLLEMGREHLERCGVSTRGLSKLELATRVLQHRSGSMTTSDFAYLLSAVANKRLRQGYEETRPTYQMWARRAPNAPDFKTMNVVQLGAAPDLLQVNEHGEFKYGAMTDGAETYSMVTYGRIVPFTRQSMVNDDMRGFDRLVGAFGNSAARLENRTVYSILTANAAMADGGNLFNATAVTTTGGHANLTGTGTAISTTSLGVGRTMMRLQKGLQSEELNITPAYLIVPATQESLAYQYTSANYVPATPANVNEFRAGGRTALEPVVEAVLDANSTTAWYLAASSAAVDTVEYCYLDGAEGPMIESEVGFEVDGIAYKCRLDFAAKAIDWRGLYKNAGA